MTLALSELDKQTRRKEAQRRYREKNPEAWAERKARWARENPERAKESKLRSRLRHDFGISLEDWREMFKAQGEACAACGANESGDKRGHWHTDHDHKTGIVRGILCHGCNTALGLLGDSTDRLLDLVNYLGSQ